MPGLELRDGNKDDEGLATALDVDLASGRDLKRTKLSLEVGGLEVEDGLSDKLLSLGGRGARSVGGAEDLGRLLRCRSARVSGWQTTTSKFARDSARGCVGQCEGAGGLDSLP